MFPTNQPDFFLSADKEIEQTFLQTIQQLCPVQQAEYLAAITAKHFTPATAIGSRFLTYPSLPFLLAAIYQQRGNSLAGDDRAKFLAAGVAPTALLPECRYLWGEAAGTLGIIPNHEVAPGEIVHVLRTKPGAPCTLYVERVTLPLTNIATVIIGPDESQPAAAKAEMIWTVHPGLPIRPATSDRFQSGMQMTLTELQKNGQGQSLFYLNVKQVTTNLL